MQWHNWAIAALGIWLIISPWLLGYASFNLVVWNNVLIGSLVVILALWNFSSPKI